MRALLATLSILLILTAAPVALGAGGGGAVGQKGGTPTASAAERTLSGSLKTGMREAGAYSGADVVDLSTGTTLYSHNATTGRLPASVEKLYTTSTALLRYGPNARLSTLSLIHI